MMGSRPDQVPLLRNPKSDNFDDNLRTNAVKGKPSLCLYVVNLITITLLVVVAFVLAPSLYHWLFLDMSVIEDDMRCKISLVESMPEGLIYNGTFPVRLSTYEAWMNLLKQAKHSVDIVSFYWTLTNGSHKSALEGENIFEELLGVVKRGVKLRIIQNIPTQHFPNEETEFLKAAGAEILSVDMTKFFGVGVLHTKFWLVDGETFYLGSANTDWRSLTQIKEIGALFSSCKSLAEDASKLVEVYAYAATHDVLPYIWPRKYWTRFNKRRPINLKLNGTDSKVYLSSSPKELCPQGRTSDISAILDVIKKANSFINIAVMDYAPVTEFEESIRFWPIIDDALRSAAIERKITINFLGSYWKQTKTEMITFLKSFAQLRDFNLPINVKMFCMPSNAEQKKIQSARVNHNKYMVTDNAAYIGTSNWAADYFLTTAGLSVVINQSSENDGQSFYKELLEVFMQDWTSGYSISIWNLPTNDTLNCSFKSI